MSKYLLELGVEELPYGLIDSLSAQIKENLKNKLNDYNAVFSQIKTYTTPRRLVFIIDGLVEIQQDSEKIYRGPNVKVAYDAEGNYTQAAIGFSRKFGVDVSEIYKVEDAGQEYIAVKVIEKGKKISEILPLIAPEAVLKVQGPHFMRWSGLDEKFSRPIRWIVSILDDKEIPVEITSIKSSKFSRAHRFTADKYPEITDVDSYLDIMYEHNVIVDEEKRKNKIVEMVNELASSINANVKIEEELLKEVSNIVEWPKPVLGDFDEKYLILPEPLIVTVMASHQRYFPIYDNNGKLLNGFITVANYIGDDVSNIKNGNERVIKARLDDAIFFYNEDIKKPLIQRVDDLEGMTFQKGLGSLKDKVSRIIKLSENIVKILGFEENDETYKNVLRTALFCKADLTTSLVFEFTELQGVIGKYYAKVFEENDAVATGIEEHYYPLVADADLASAIEGQIVGIADKLDTICGVFVLDKIPSGSADPLGVRRAAIGILQTIMKKHLKLNLFDLISLALDKFDIDVNQKTKLQKNISAFFIQRLKGIFANKYTPDVIEAVISARGVLNSLSELIEKLDLINEVFGTEEFNKIVSTHSRIFKLVKNNEKDTIEQKETHSKMASFGDILADTKSDFTPKTDILSREKSSFIQYELFASEAEENLYRYYVELNSKRMISPKAFYEFLVKFIPIIDKFFEDVLVMDENIQVRNNRLRLLNSINKEFLKIADFTKITK